MGLTVALDDGRAACVDALELWACQRYLETTTTAWTETGVRGKLPWLNADNRHYVGSSLYASDELLGMEPEVPPGSVARGHCLGSRNSRRLPSRSKA